MDVTLCESTRGSQTGMCINCTYSTDPVNYSAQKNVFHFDDCLSEIRKQSRPKKQDNDNKTLADSTE